MKKLLYFTAIIGLLFTIASCQQDGAVYELTDKVEASFPSKSVNYQMIKEDGNKIVVEMWRGNTKGAVIVPVTVTDETDGVFIPAKKQFDFADGENKAYLTFTYPDINEFAGEKYEIKLAINKEMVSPGGISDIKISAQRKLTFKSLGIGTFTTEFFEESWDQEIMKAEEADFYRLPDCYYEGYHIEFSIQDGKVDFGDQAMGYKYEGTAMTYWVNKSDKSTFDGETFTFIPYFFVPDLGGGFGENTEVFVMPK